ncbi:alcohol dehydrogenase catalytic domain-containing protein [Kineosporia sp. R_H_3]|uniref:alcohol dehydrogenase catalytic domain-containing protein n=1 Tax=Kineosporia sp. R_H_3 TaxID=1961848 RepID=UPI000B4A785C|nr:alcohol dehydrogenase catalytic domain-containing protein [Kineosporia sp. R_H_3]
MRAVLLEEYGVVPRVADVPDPVCPPDGVVVRVEATGLCRSDWHTFEGHFPDIPLPHVPGHEFAGVVETVGADVTGWRPGDRVTAPFVNACGTCPTCRRGDHQVCERQTQPGFDGWGSFAELVVVERAPVNLVAVPDGVDSATAAALGCRFATAYRAVVEVGRVRAGEWVAVHGCGGVGLSAVMVAVAAGARVVAVDVRPGPLALATALGAEAVVDAHALDLPFDQQSGATAGPLAVGEAVRAAAGGAVDLSLDALGSPATCAASIAGLRPRGRHVQVGLLPAAVGWPQVPMHLAVAGELELLGSHGMAAHSYPGMLGLVVAGRLSPLDLVTGRVGLDDVPVGLASLGTAPPTGMTVALPNG